MKLNKYIIITFFLLLFLLLIILSFFFSNTSVNSYNSNISLINHSNNEQNKYEYQGLKIIANLTPNDYNEGAFNNTIKLQNYINQVSEKGGGIVYIPKGTYYFRVNSEDFENNYVKTGNSCHYIIWCKNNVTIQGDGIDNTILKPYGTYPYGVNMFHYTTNFNEKNTGIAPTYIENADFINFTIDSTDEQYGSKNPDYKIEKAYHAMGKGFMMAPIKNCDWNNVKVINTDGTGFGVDLPVNCTISNCIAEGCGKQATEKDVGASGFGIGTGYTNNESIIIKDCISRNNKKYGFFFENQTRFSKFYNQPSQAYTSEGYVVINCIASGNLYDFGGERANDVIYENCLSEGIPINKSISYNYHSFNTYLSGINIEKKFDDIDYSSQYYNSIYWAYNNGITNGLKPKEFYFGENSKSTRAHAILFLFRYANMPGEIITWSNSDVSKKITSRYSDISENSSYFDAVEWAANTKIIDSDGVSKFNPDSLCTRSAFITMLWRYAGRPKVDNLNYFPDVPNTSWYKDAVNWALSKNIINEKLNYFRPNDAISRGEIVEYLYRYNNSNETTFNIKYYLLGGKFSSIEKTSYISGKDYFNLETPSKEGYIFDGWTGNISNEYSYNNYIPIKNISILKSDTGNKVYTANWSPINYTIQFNSNSGSGIMDDQFFIYDSPQLLKTNSFTKEDYLFKEWNTKPDGTGKSLTNNQIINNLTITDGDIITLYAIWIPDNYKITNYQVEDNYICISQNTTVSEFKENIILNSSGMFNIFNRDGYEITDDSYILGTGMNVKIVLVEKIVDLYIVVSGDIDGNGIINAQDLSMINKYRLNKLNLEDIYFRAADINNDRLVNIIDLFQINKSRLDKTYNF